MIRHGVQHQISQSFWEESVHYLIYGMAVDLGHNRLITTHTIGNAVGKVQLVLVADLGTKQIVERFNDF